MITDARAPTREHGHRGIGIPESSMSATQCYMTEGAKVRAHGELGQDEWRTGNHRSNRRRTVSPSVRLTPRTEEEERETV